MLVLKLIRDKYISEIPKERLTTVSPTSKEYREFLIDKLFEELKELEHTNWKDLDEYADVYEVFTKIMELNGVTAEQVISTKARKRALLGGFDNGVILTY
jgi:predicted house-cleaning noncanonical NTP pyrophosphatase (MazG superfamily)